MKDEDETTFYCERVQRKCPVTSRFRYCWDCILLQELVEDYDARENEVAGNGSMGN